MSEHDSFEDRLRAIADQVSQSVRRMSEVDVEKLAEMYGVDAERARDLADVAGQWLSDRMSGAEPLFDQNRAPLNPKAPGGPGRAPASRPTSRR